MHLKYLVITRILSTTIYLSSGSTLLKTISKLKHLLKLALIGLFQQKSKRGWEGVWGHKYFFEKKKKKKKNPGIFRYFTLGNSGHITVFSLENPAESCYASWKFQGQGQKPWPLEILPTHINIFDHFWKFLIFFN